MKFSLIYESGFHRWNNINYLWSSSICVQWKELWNKLQTIFMACWFVCINSLTRHRPFPLHKMYNSFIFFVVHSHPWTFSYTKSIFSKEGYTHKMVADICSHERMTIFTVLYSTTQKIECFPSVPFGPLHGLLNFSHFLLFVVCYQHQYHMMIQTSANCSLIYSMRMTSWEIYHEINENTT